MYQREWVGIMLTVLALGFVVYVNLKSGNEPKKKVDTTEEPISQPVDEWNQYMDSVLLHRLDAVMDSMNMDCGK